MWSVCLVFCFCGFHSVCPLMDKDKSGTTDWFQIGKGVLQGCILSPCLFNLYAEYIMRNAGLEETQAGLKIARRNINNLKYADDSLMAESKEELKSLLMKVKGKWKSWFYTVQEIWFLYLGWEAPLEKGMATHSNILAWRIPWTEEPSGLQSIGLQRKIEKSHSIQTLYSQSYVFSNSHVQM